MAKLKRKGFSDAQAAAARNVGDKPGSTPKIVRDAFLPAAVSVSDTVLMPVRISHIQLLEAVGSPFVSKKEKGFVPSLSDVLTAFYILATPPPTARAALAKGRPAFDEAVASLSDTMPVTDIPGLAAKLNAHLDGAFESAIPGKEPGESPLAVSPAGTTGSAGR